MYNKSCEGQEGEMILQRNYLQNFANYSRDNYVISIEKGREKERDTESYVQKIILSALYICVCEIKFNYFII